MNGQITSTRTDPRVPPIIITAGKTLAEYIAEALAYVPFGKSYTCKDVMREQQANLAAIEGAMRETRELEQKVWYAEIDLFQAMVARSCAAIKVLSPATTTREFVERGAEITKGAFEDAAARCNAIRDMIADDQAAITDGLARRTLDGLEEIGLWIDAQKTENKVTAAESSLHY